MSMLRENLSEALVVGHFDVFQEDLDQWPEEYSRCFNLKGSKRRVETTIGFSGFGTATVKPEGVGLSYDDILQGYKGTFTHVTYSLGYRVSQELYEDDLYSIIDALPRELSKAMQYTVEVIGAARFNNGFTDSAAYLGPDGEPLFGDGSTKTHPNKSGGTWANQLSTAADLSVDSAELMVEMLEETTNEQGLLVMLKAATFVVPPQLRFIAKELFDPAAAKEKPHTSLRGINPLAGEDLNYYVWHWLTDPDAFFLKATQHKLLFIWRVRPDFDNGDDFDTKDAKFSSRMRLSEGIEDPRGWVGSPGES